MASVTFPSHHPWVRLAAGAPADNRPYAEVLIVGPTSSVRVWCLVDSGADRLTVDTAVAATTGTSLVHGTIIHSATVTGAPFSSTEVNSVDVTVETTTMTNQEVRFGPTGCYPVLGRVTLLDFFSDFGFDNAGWQHT